MSQINNICTGRSIRNSFKLKSRELNSLPTYDLFEKSKDNAKNFMIAEINNLALPTNGIGLNAGTTSRLKKLYSLFSLINVASRNKYIGFDKAEKILNYETLCTIVKREFPNLNDPDKFVQSMLVLCTHKHETYDSIGSDTNRIFDLKNHIKIALNIPVSNYFFYNSYDSGVDDSILKNENVKAYFEGETEDNNIIIASLFTINQEITHTNIKLKNHLSADQSVPLTHAILANKMVDNNFLCSYEIDLSSKTDTELKQFVDSTFLNTFPEKIDTFLKNAKPHLRSIDKIMEAVSSIEPREEDGWRVYDYIYNYKTCFNFGFYSCPLEIKGIKFSIRINPEKSETHIYLLKMELTRAQSIATSSIAYFIKNEHIINEYNKFFNKINNIFISALEARIPVASPHVEHLEESQMPIVETQEIYVSYLESFFQYAFGVSSFSS